MIANITIENHVATIQLSNPGAMNTIRLKEFGELRELFLSLRDNDDVRAIILTGEGKAFCAGAALDSFVDDGRLTLTAAELRATFNEDLNPLLRTMMDMPKPIVTAINGTVAGGGMGLALAGDITIASEQARLYCGFVKMLAIVPDAGTSWMLPNLMGRNKALPFALLGDAITAREACEAGLIYKTVPAEELMSQAQYFAGRLIDLPGETLRHVRNLFNEALSTSYSDLLDRERDINCELLERPEMAEGVLAFLEKRKPNFVEAARHHRKP